MENNTSTNSPDLLQDFEQEYQYEDASTGLRLANYLIDLVVSIGVSFAFVFVLIMTTQSDAIVYWFKDLPPLAGRLLSLIFFGLFMSLIEGFTKGRSLGKLITGTKAIRWDNQPFGWGDAFGRAFSRMVPFEPFSALWGSPWHDKWTDTRVVKVRR